METKLNNLKRANDETRLGNYIQSLWSSSVFDKGTHSIGHQSTSICRPTSQPDTVQIWPTDQSIVALEQKNGVLMIMFEVRKLFGCQQKTGDKCIFP